MIRLDILIAEGFPLLSLSLVIEPLRVANRESLRQRFTWRVLAPGKRAVKSSSGIVFTPDGGLDDGKADVVILLCSYRPEQSITPEIIAWLKRRAVHGCLMGCVDTGAIVFAEAGLLQYCPAAVHHEALAGFQQKHGESFFVDRLFDFSPPRCSSAGGVVTIDLTLSIIEHFGSVELAYRVAEILNYRRLEGERTQGVFGKDWSVARLNRDLARCVEIMISHVGTPLSASEIATRAGLQVRQMRKLFTRYLKQSPTRHFQTLRLEQARNLLRNSHQAVGTIAVLCGFENIETFSRAYKKHYGVPPSKDRNF